MRLKTTLKKLLRNSFKKAIHGEWKELGYYIISESINIIIDILPSTKNVKCPLCQKSNKNFIHLGNKNSVLIGILLAKIVIADQDIGAYFFYTNII